MAIAVNPNELSVEDQKVLGKKIAEYILANPTTFPILDENDPNNELAYHYLRDSIFQVAINTHAVTRRLELDWQITIIEDDNERSMFTLPGGEMFIYTGLLKFLENNAELTGVIAHEIAYADGDLVVDNLIDQFEGRALVDIIRDNDQNRLEEVSEYFKIIGYEKEIVNHADTFAMELICPFRYDPRGLRNVLERANNDPNEFKWIQTKNPEPAVRKEYIEDFLSRHPCEDNSNILLKNSYERFIEQYLP